MSHDREYSYSDDSRNPLVGKAILYYCNGSVYAQNTTIQRSFIYFIGVRPFVLLDFIFQTYPLGRSSMRSKLRKDGEDPVMVHRLSRYKNIIFVHVKYADLVHDSEPIPMVCEFSVMTKDYCGVG